MASIQLSTISGTSMEEILNAIERQRKDIEFIMANLDDDNIKEVSGEKVINLTIDQAQIRSLLVDSANIKDLSVSSAKIANLAVNTAKLADAAITNAKIDRASVDKLVVVTADIADAAITNAKIDRASVDKLVVRSADIADAQIKNAHIENATIDGAAKIKLASISTGLIQDAAITTALINNLAVTDAKIVSITANKLTAGTIDTGLVTVSGAGGKLMIKNNRIQVFDNQQVPVERVAMGDVMGDGTVYGFLMRGADGTTVLMDINGVKSAGITDGAITNPKIGAGAVTNNNIYAGTITGDRMVADTITSRELAVGSITAAKAIIANAAIGTAQIIDLAVTDAKIDTINARKITTTGGTYYEENLARMAGVAVSSNATEVPANAFSKINDGIKAKGSTNYAGFGNTNAGGATVGGTGTEGNYIQYDLKAVYRIAESKAYFYSAAERFYYYKIKYSSDNVNWFYAVGDATRWVKSTPPSKGGSTMNPTRNTFSIPIAARYIRLYADGNSVNTGNHVDEWELFSVEQVSIEGGEIRANSIIAGDITFKGTLEGANGTFSGVLENVNGTKKVTISNGGIAALNPNGNLNMESGAYLINYNPSTGSSEAAYGISGMYNNVGGHSFSVGAKIEGANDALELTSSKGTIRLKNYTEISGQLEVTKDIGTTTTYSSMQGELKGTDGGNVGLAFHRSGYTAVSLVHRSSGRLDLLDQSSALADMYLKGVNGSYGSMIESRDEWLRLNDLTEHTNGIYCHNSVLRTDGQIHIGASGATLLATSSAFTYKGDNILRGYSGTAKAVYRNTTQLTVRVTYNITSGTTARFVATIRWVTGNVSMQKIATVFMENVTTTAADIRIYCDTAYTFSSAEEVWVDWAVIPDV